METKAKRCRELIKKSRADVFATRTANIGWEPYLKARFDIKNELESVTAIDRISRTSSREKKQKQIQNSGLCMRLKKIMSSSSPFPEFLDYYSEILASTYLRYLHLKIN